MKHALHADSHVTLSTPGGAGGTCPALGGGAPFGGFGKGTDTPLSLKQSMKLPAGSACAAGATAVDMAIAAVAATMCVIFIPKL